jgi:dephospho-CoA kinase
MSRSFRLGITGKIGSGKSVFSELLRSNGISVLDSDKIAKEVMLSDSDVREGLISLFGPEAFTDNKLNTGFLASQIFSSDEKRIAVEALVHPKVSEILERGFDTTEAGKIIAVESALLLQTGYDQMFDALILIASSDELILERNRASKRFAEKDLLARLAEQSFTSDDEADADFVIKNDSTLDVFTERSKKVLTILEVMAMGSLPDEPLRSVEISDTE